MAEKGRASRQDLNPPEEVERRWSFESDADRAKASTPRAMAGKGSGSRQDLKHLEQVERRWAFELDTDRAKVSTPHVEQEKMWAELVEKKLQELSEVTTPTASFRPKFRVFRVQRHLKAEKLAHFRPQLMFLGLFNKRFHPDVINSTGERFKLRMVSAFLRILQDPGLGGDLSWGKVSEIVVDNPDELQQCYYDKTWPRHRSEDTVRRALTLDAVFLAGFLTGYLPEEVTRERIVLPGTPGRHDDDHIKTRYLRLGNIVRNEDLSFRNLVADDIFKVENQIPMDLIRNVLGILFPDRNAEVGVLINELCRGAIKTISLTLPGFSDKHFRRHFVSHKLVDFGSECDHLLECVCRVMRGDDGSGGTGKGSDSSNATRSGLDRDHLWAVARMCFLRVVHLYPLLDHAFGNWILKRTLRKNEHKIEKISLPSMTKLRDAGIHVRGDARGTFDLLPQFKPGILRGTLYIPTFSILHRTETLWKNMVAYESETVLPDERGVHDQFIYFLKFMDELIDTEADVALLRKGRRPVIPKNLLGTETDVAELFNSITQHYTVDDLRGGGWVDLRSQIDGFYNQKSRRMFLEFLKYNFGKPWFLISLVAAIMLLAMTFLQTLYTMLGYYAVTI